ncbi:phospholipase D-like domain-containing protein [Nitrosovibrio tenuis]|uniref:Cardiolipin synthase n=1 Tax=Nitrosovibrio tenuis TaxID=1233 RepID=A0A1H7MD37_9PROT|nr:phospholipase D-like domain-containing protein [Nitrosovibrio tenuis]SEL09074.1 cardiolipin synthase [Nitrosovibrio tenuis]
MAKLKGHPPEATHATRIMAAQAFSRAAGAPLVHGNSIRLLKDADENYPAWFTAIHSAEKNIYFENYIIRDDNIGRQFSDSLIAKAKEGVRVRLLYDWMGALTETSSGFWRRLREGGVEVRCFNPPRFDSPLGWLSRLHRKSLCVDTRVAFVSGLCVGQMWVGYPERGIPPWRDTGVEVSGPIVADVIQSFSRAWAEVGPKMASDELPSRGSIPLAGAIDMRVLGDSAATAGLYRLEQLIAVLAQKTLWLTDAYFVGTTSYVQALRGAARDGVDVRLLVPGSSGDLKFLRPVSRAGYRPLLEAGVRVFEWNGSMLHAKTAVADGRWARVGSSNLNLSSWLGNWELDVAVENLEFAHQMEQMYLKDLDNATEIVLSEKNRVRPVAQPKPGRSSYKSLGHRKGGSAGRLTAGAIRVGNTVGAAITSRLVLGAAEAKIMLFGGAVLLSLAVLSLVQPLLTVIPFSLIAGWIGVSLLIKAYHLHRDGLNGTVSGRAEDKVTDKVVEIPVLLREQTGEREPDSKSMNEPLRASTAAKPRDAAGES